MDYCSCAWMSKDEYGEYMEKYGKITNRCRTYDRFFPANTPYWNKGCFMWIYKEIYRRVRSVPRPTHGAGAVSGAGDTRAECCGQRRLCHRGAGDTRNNPDGAEPDLLPRAALLAARILSPVLCGASCRAGADCDVIRGITGNTGV